MTMDTWSVPDNHTYNAQLKIAETQRFGKNGDSTSALVVHCVVQEIRQCRPSGCNPSPMFATKDRGAIRFKNKLSRAKQFPVLNLKRSMEDAIKSKEGLGVSGLKSSVLFSSSTVILRDLLRPLGCY